MKRLLFLITVFAVIVAACAADSANPTTATSATGTGSTVADSSSTDPGSGKPVIPADAPDAPDFVFTLGDGTDYHLGSDNKPVYLIFWAQW